MNIGKSRKLPKAQSGTKSRLKLRFAFLRYFMRAGSALVKPLLEHFAVVLLGTSVYSWFRV